MNPEFRGSLFCLSDDDFFQHLRDPANQAVLVFRLDILLEQLRILAVVRKHVPVPRNDHLGPYVSREVGRFLVGHVPDAIAQQALRVPSVDGKKLCIQGSERLQRGHHPLVSDRIARVVYPYAVAFDHILKMREETGFLILVQKLVRRCDGTDGHVTDPDRLARIQSDRVPVCDPVVGNGPFVRPREDELGLRVGFRPDSPGRVIDVVDVVVGPQEGVHPHKFLCRDGRFDLPDLGRRGIVVNDDQGALGRQS